MFFVGLPIFFYSNQPHTKITGYTKPCAKLSQSDLLSGYIQIIISCWSNTLPFEMLSRWEPFLFQSYTTRSTTNLSLILSVILYKMVGARSFWQLYLCIQPPLQSPTKIPSPTSAIFHLPSPPLSVHQIILTIFNNTAFLYTSAIFHLHIFAYSHSYSLHQKYFPAPVI